MKKSGIWKKLVVAAAAAALSAASVMSVWASAERLDAFRVLRCIPLLPDRLPSRKQLWIHNWHQRYFYGSDARRMRDFQC